jgi:predicted RNase H-like HicB family nuclease
VVKLIHGAIEFHIEGLKKDGEPVPKPSSSLEFVEVAA